MTNPIRKLAVAAVLAALAPAIASACEPEPPRAAVAIHAGVGPAVYWTGDRDGDDGGDAWRDRDGDRWRERERWHARRAWLERERAEIRAGYARLDEARADFYAVPHRPWRVRQFEAWYAHERAELDARWQRVDWR